MTEKAMKLINDTATVWIADDSNLTFKNSFIQGALYGFKLAEELKYDTLMSLIEDKIKPKEKN